MIEKDYIRFYLPKKAKRELKRIANEKGLSMTTLINLLINDYLDKMREAK